MEDMELKNIWKEYDRRIEESKILNMQSWALNIKTYEYLQTQKAKSGLNALSGFKKWMIFAGILFIAFLVLLIIKSLKFQNIYFIGSLSSIVIFNILAIIFYLRHIVLIHEIDNTESLVEVQEKIVKLQTSTLRITKILFLQTPFYSTFFWSRAMITGNPTAFFFIAVPVTLFFAALSIWLYRNINYHNAGKRWFRILFSSKEWTSIIKAVNFLKEIEEFKKEAV
ncbi:MAG TPA: hypothetical protein VMT76_18665 [Puia sp.]|nr:hypothetical protein [Puia sp.]